MIDASDPVAPVPPKPGRQPWVVAPKSGFIVDDPAGYVGLSQINKKEFLVTHVFEFADQGVKKKLVKLLRDKKVEEPEEKFELARRFTVKDQPTDLASIPAFMRWFESSYGLHTLAAIIHDKLIDNSKPNNGALQSDALSDYFFREMMKSAGVPWLKRSIMWAAVVIRSRWHAGVFRAAGIALWVALACFGIATFWWSIGAEFWHWRHPVDPVYLFAFSALGWLPAAGLWASQWRAGLVAAIAGFWIIPPGVLALVGYRVYAELEILFSTPKRALVRLLSFLALGGIAALIIWLVAR